jgi:hypothetical protein
VYEALEYQREEPTLLKSFFKEQISTCDKFKQDAGGSKTNGMRAGIGKLAKTRYS